MLSENSDLPYYHNDFLGRELISKTLVKYLESLSSEGKKLLSLNIISKYAENKSLEKLNKMKSLMIIYSKKSFISKIETKHKKFLKWKKICIDLGINMSSTFNSRSLSCKLILIK